MDDDHWDFEKPFGAPKPYDWQTLKADLWDFETPFGHPKPYDWE